MPFVVLALAVVRHAQEPEVGADRPHILDTDTVATPTRPQSRDTGMSPPPPPPDYSPGELFDDSLVLYERCLGAGVMEASYHALVVAMHCAEAAWNRNGIELVIRLARERQQAIDAERPLHPLSTGVADEAGVTRQFQTLATTAKAIRTRLGKEAQASRNRDNG